MSAMIAAAPLQKVVHVIQGDYVVTDDPSVTLSAILGSCVACCLYDPVVGVGGMNHFLLPGDDSRKDDGLRYGVNSMELLINGLLRYGGARADLEAKLFGGARMLPGLSDIGAQNAAFAQHFLKEEKISCVGVSLGGLQARRIRFLPTTGAAKQLLLDNAESNVIVQQSRKRIANPVPSDAGSVDLF